MAIDFAIREASMYRSEDEKLTDVMIGEAVLTLLKSDKTGIQQRLNRTARTDGC
ncbi:Uncharacterised protein [Pantoea agglomerans]|uniref:Uncharacterized protein n=1 Tax=Enterobacter agglomerans TaxID=549 RepID=A0A379LS31_ENTAG|nr:Uncharacterised protein [Pantoea agglomerans]